jgi:hypothetical protein
MEFEIDGQKMKKIIIGETVIYESYGETKPMPQSVITEDTPRQVEIDFAEYVISTEDRIAALENKINTLTGGN